MSPSDGIVCSAPEHAVENLVESPGRITFGVHKLFVPLIRWRVCVISQTFLFCQEHYSVFLEKLLKILEEVCEKDPSRLSHTDSLKYAEGCWISCAPEGRHVPFKSNFQLPYPQFEIVYNKFMPTVRIIPER